jgi:hypothetical protein
MITSTALGSYKCSHILFDTGSQITAINLALAKKHHLAIQPIKASDPQTLSLAQQGTYAKRLGYVIIPVCISFSEGKQLKMPMKCEVLNMTYDLLLGQDVLPLLFPNDEIMDYMPKAFQWVDGNLVPQSIAKVTLAYSVNAVLPETIVENRMVSEYVESRANDQIINSIITEIDGDKLLNTSGIVQ